MKYNNKYIGTNHLASGWNISKVLSSFDKEFTTEEVLIADGIGDRIPCVIGDVKEAYEMLKDKIKNYGANSIEDTSCCVFEVV